jgi:hypothetical protein
MRRSAPEILTLLEHNAEAIKPRLRDTILAEALHAPGL